MKNAERNKQDAYEDLANAIIKLATEDYLAYNRNYFKLRDKRDKELVSPTELTQRSDESDYCFRQRKVRHSATHYSNKMKTYKFLAGNIREFLLGDWMGAICWIDGEYILNKLDEQLEKEGHKLWELN